MTTTTEKESRLNLHTATKGVMSGAVTGIAVAIIDLSLAKPESQLASGWAYYLFFISFLGLAGGILFWSLHLWKWIIRYVISPERGKVRLWSYWCVVTSPLVAFVWWVPWSWLNDHWEGLTGFYKILATSIYVLAALGVIIGARIAYLINSQTVSRLWINLWLRGFYLFLAAACSYADKVVLPGLYDDFHYGLTGGTIVFLFVFWQVPVPDPVSSRIGRVYPSISIAILLSSLLAVFILHGSVGAISIDSGSLIFSKIVHVVRQAADFDRDGISTLFGGHDCDDFNPKIGPNRFDMPGNGIDEDCSAQDTKWPKPLPSEDKPWSYQNLPNIVFIIVDALRADHLGIYGYTRKTSPVLDKLANEGLLFSNAYSQSPKTFGSMPSIMTGLYPSNLSRDYHHKRARSFRRPYAYCLGKEAPLLAEMLKAKGYITHAYVSKKIVHTLGLNRGFDKFKVDHGQNRSIENFIQNVDESPFFLWIHYDYPHSPYKKQKEYDFGNRPIDRYDGNIAKNDSVIGALLALMEERNLIDNTLFIITADHGEEFEEHGGKFHGRKLYRELTHVPLIVKGPRIDRKIVDDPVELVDIVPALAQVLRLGLDQNQFDGESLFNPVHNRRHSVGAYSEVFTRNDGVRGASFGVSSWRYIFDLSKDRVELYDIENDPQEKENVALLHPEVVRTLSEAIKSRPLRRQGILFRRFENAHDIEYLAHNLWILRREELLLAALEKFTEGDIEKYKDELKDLAERSLLPQSVIDRIDKFLDR